MKSEPPLDPLSQSLENRDPPPLDLAYAHARRAYGLVSGLLIAWELVGIELASSPLEHVKLTLKSPQAAPYVLIVLILYFGLRATIEWYQNDIRRRKLRASRMDFAMSHTIAIGALALYGFQTLSRVQLANYITRNQALLVVLGMGFSWTITLFVVERRQSGKISIIDLILPLIVASLLGYQIVGSLIVGQSGVILPAIAGMAAGILVVLLFLWGIRGTHFPGLSSARRRVDKR